MHLPAMTDLGGWKTIHGCRQVRLEDWTLQFKLSSCPTGYGFFPHQPRYRLYPVLLRHMVSPMWVSQVEVLVMTGSVKSRSSLLTRSSILRSNYSLQTISESGTNVKPWGHELNVTWRTLSPPRLKLARKKGGGKLAVKPDGNKSRWEWISLSYSYGWNFI